VNRQDRASARTATWTACSFEVFLETNKTGWVGCTGKEMNLMSTALGKNEKLLLPGWKAKAGEIKVGGAGSSNVFRLQTNNRTTKHQPLLPSSSSMTTHFQSTQEEL
jgi:hypothetical protein